MRSLKRVLGAALGASMLALALVAPVSAHSTPDNAPDTPVANASATGFANFVAALGHSQAINSLLRNPTCGAHSIHPVGNQ